MDDELGTCYQLSRTYMNVCPDAMTQESMCGRWKVNLQRTGDPYGDGYGYGNVLGHGYGYGYGYGL